MRKSRLACLGSLMVLGGWFSPQAYSQDDETGEQSAELVIAGGALAATTDDVWESFVRAAGEEGPVVIVPAASGSPHRSAQSAKETLSLHGIDPSRVQVAKLATKDDSSTPRVNEARWVRNADDPQTVSLLSSAAAIWFTGGDQARISALLLDDDGDDTEALAAIRAASSSGAVIGGTSAGAAMMSRAMIIQGDSVAALSGSSEGEPLEVAQGLGFLPYGIVDQHFGERARLGRLIRALALQPDQTLRVGFGIDEDTGFIVSRDGRGTVAGKGYVTIVDGRQAVFTSTDDNRLTVSGLTLHLLSAGDGIDLMSLALTPADWKEATVGNEYVENALPGGVGMAIQGQMLANVIGEGLVDNQAASTVDRVSFDGTGRGFVYAFTQIPASAGFWGRDAEGRARYTIANVRMDVVPVDLSMERVQ